MKTPPWPVLNAAARRRARRLALPRSGRVRTEAVIAAFELAAEEMRVVVEVARNGGPTDRAIEAVRSARTARAPGTLVWFRAPDGIDGAWIRERNRDGTLVASMRGGSRIVLRAEDVFDTWSDARAKGRRA